MPFQSVSFFYWNVKFNLTGGDRNFLDGLNSGKFYVRFFDVVWDDVQKEAMPADKVLFTGDKPGIEIIPVVFITISALKNTDVNNIPLLAANIAEDVRARSSKHGIPVNEIVLDHDWTDITSGKYFALIGYVKKYFGGERMTMKVSSTIRLHQYKFYRDTGVPPADRGYLMIYNTHSPGQYTTRNTIFDVDSVKWYLDSEDYPIEIAPCFPLFSWAIQYDVNGKFIRLFNDPDINGITKNSGFSRSKNVFTAKYDSTFCGKKIFAGDRLKYDTVDYEDVKKIINIFNNKLHYGEIIFYNYDSDSLKKRGIYGPDAFKNIFDL